MTTASSSFGAPGSGSTIGLLGAPNAITALPPNKDHLARWLLAVGSSQHPGRGLLRKAGGRV